MAEPTDIPAWIAFFIGLYALAAGVGELRSAGGWAAMLADFERQPGLRFIAGLFALTLGAAVYLVNPWRPDDWLAVLVSIIGGAMVAEGALILAAGDRFLALARALIGRATQIWAGISALFGIALVLVAIARF